MAPTGALSAGELSVGARAEGATGAGPILVISPAPGAGRGSGTADGLGRGGSATGLAPPGRVEGAGAVVRTRAPSLGPGRGGGPTRVTSAEPGRAADRGVPVELSSRPGCEAGMGGMLGGRSVLPDFPSSGPELVRNAPGAGVGRGPVSADAGGTTGVRSVVPGRAGPSGGVLGAGGLLGGRRLLPVRLSPGTAAAPDAGLEGRAPALLSPGTGAAPGAGPDRRALALPLLSPGTGAPGGRGLPGSAALVELGGTLGGRRLPGTGVARAAGSAAMGGDAGALDERAPAPRLSPGTGC